jgi:hypothetical protein
MGAVLAAGLSLALGSLLGGNPATAATTAAAGTAAAGTAAAGTAAAGTVSLQALLHAPLAALGRPAVAPAGTKELGLLPISRRMHLGIALAPRNPAALTAYATSVNTPGSQDFGRYIDPAQFRTAFGPSPSSIETVQRVLRAEGFSVSAPSSNGLIIPVTASVAVVQRSLHVSLRSYRLDDGTIGWAATTAPLVQSPVAHDVTAVLGLDQLIGPHSFLERPRSDAAAARHALARPVVHASTNGGPQACAAAQHGAARGEGWTFNQLASAYGVEGLYNDGALGQGQTVAVFELEPFLASDIATFDTCYFGATAAAQMLSRLSVVKVNGGIPTGSGTGEAVLDVEDISALAPQAHIQVYEAPSSDIGTEYATTDIYNAMVNNDSANVISTSWGLCEPAFEIAAPGAQEVENEIFEEAAAQGQSTFAAAGDAGSNDCSFVSHSVPPAVAVDDPASQPFVVGVGGTSLHSDTQPPRETVWDDGAFGGGGGGGISTTWPSPGWQADSGVAGVSNSYSQSAAYQFCVPATDRRQSDGASPPPCREVPDVTMDADEDTGTSFYQANEGGWSTIGGTSTSAPMFAAITTDIASSTGCSSLAVNPTNHDRDLGFVAPAFYEAEATSPAGTDFNDITVGTNDIFDLGKGYPATTGYDLASGLGSPIVTDPAAGRRGSPADGDGTGLASSLCELLTPSASRPAVTGLSPAHGSVDGGNQVTVKGTGFAGSGVSVEAISFGPTRATTFTVESATAISATAPPSAPQPGTGGETEHTPGPVDVTVTIDTPAGVTTTRADPTTSRYIYVAGSSGSALPSVSAVGPSAGPVAGDNTVDVFGSGFGSGGPISSVTFGGVRATSVKYLTNYELQVVVPAESKATACATGKGFDPANTCQVEVVVTGANGKSSTSKILAPYTGDMTANDEGIIVPTPGTEIDPAPSEYDYAPLPTITSITPNPYSEAGFKPITINGTGFNVLTLDWVNIGVPTQWDNTYAGFVSVADNRILVVPALPPGTSKPTPVPGGVSILGLGGLSKAAAFSYTR